jgi:hypothetical protein
MMNVSAQTTNKDLIAQSGVSAYAKASEDKPTTF